MPSVPIPMLGVGLQWGGWCSGARATAARGGWLGWWVGGCGVVGRVAPGSSQLQLVLFCSCGS